MPPVRRDKEKVNGTRKRKSLSYAKKKGLYEWQKDNPSYNQEDLAKKFDISKSQICNILKEKEKWLSIDISNKKVKNQKWDRGAKFPEIESALYLWMQQALASNLTITGDVLKTKALNFATKLQITSFIASDGWLAKFKKRYNIRQINKAREANSASLETLEEEHKILQEIIEQYDLCDVYNVDETGKYIKINTILFFFFTKNFTILFIYILTLFWNLEPSKTLSDHYISGTKKSKNRITIVLTCNANGSHRLPALVIHK